MLDLIRSNCITFKGYCNKFNHVILTSVIRLMHANHFLLFRQLLLDIFAEEWNVLAQFTGTLVIGFKLFGEKVLLNFKDLVMASLEIYMSIGGEFELNNKSSDYFFTMMMIT